jgi:hypothetical protein
LFHYYEDGEEKSRESKILPSPSFFNTLRIEELRTTYLCTVFREFRTPWQEGMAKPLGKAPSANTVLG